MQIQLICLPSANSGIDYPVVMAGVSKAGKGFIHQKYAVYSVHLESILMEISHMKRSSLLLTIFYCSLLASTASNAETTTTTTTTNPDGSTTVEETTTTDESSSQVTDRNLIGPAGVTGTIRRSDRRQDRRQEEDLDNLGDAIDRRHRR